MRGCFKLVWDINVIVLSTLLEFSPLAVGGTPDVRQDFLRHAQIHPQVLGHGRSRRDVSTLKHSNHKDGLRVAFTAFGKPYTLDLRMTKDLLPLSYLKSTTGTGVTWWSAP
uniref:Putative zinc metalloproteinase n=1 Tax=Ixodes ricinus TaxID=34613 RepID=A0A0K8RCJ3_IXORI